MDFNFEAVVKIFSSWEVIFVFMVIIVIFPLIFYLASFGKTPVQFKKRVAGGKKPVQSPPVKTTSGSEAADKDFSIDDSEVDRSIPRSIEDDRGTPGR
jgi:hypothetical protein